MQYLKIENPLQWIGIIVLIFGTLVAYNLFTDEYEAIVSNRKVIKKRFNFRRLFRLLFNHTGTWITTIKKHKVCRTPAGQKKGKADPLAIIVLVIYISFFLNSGHWLYAVSLLDSRINLWEFQRYGLPNLEFVPYVGQHLLFVTWNWNVEHPYISGWFNAVYLILGLAGLHKTVAIWFPHSQKAKAVERVILDDKDLPDDYASIVQLNRDQVRVCYAGHSISGDIFVNKKREISEGVGHEVDIRLGNYGEVYITFGSPYRQVKPKGEWRQQEHRLVLEKPEDTEYEGYVYAFRTHNAQVSDELKIGRCNDPQATLKTYARGHSNIRFILLVPESKNFNESLVHQALDKFKLHAQDGRKGGGEFFRECDGLYRILKTMLNRLPAETLKASVLPEGIEEAFADAD